MREAENAQKREPLEALETAPCKLPDLCRMQRTCVRGYRQHVDAFDELLRAKTAPDATTSEDVERVRTHLATAQPLIQACATAEAVVRREYDL